ncbi:hypothetical protein GF391_02585 [Candidatus Uhrbacteria bacterium]|nr:hypothetical protein [Candidatus Uhrbacteria bacterium]
MNRAIKASFGLTLLILILAAAVWIIVYYTNQPPPAPESPESTQKQTQTTTIAQPQIQNSTGTLELPFLAGDFVPNPFIMRATSTFMHDRAWSLKDATGSLIASGTIPGLLSSYSNHGKYYWYTDFPASQNGELVVSAAENAPQLIIPVKLENLTQTVEIYFRDASLSDCSSVESVKRSIVSTGSLDLFFYEAALRELLKGPTKTEAEQGLVTMIPDGVRVIRVGKNEKGRYIADLTPNLKDPNQSDCFYNIAKNQIQKTLATVPLPGTTLEGIIYINGEVVE